MEFDFGDMVEVVKTSAYTSEYHRAVGHYGVIVGISISHQFWQVMFWNGNYPLHFKIEELRKVERKS